MKVIFPILVLLLVSCTQMRSEYYVGEKEPVFEEYEDDVSVWKRESKVFYVKPIDSYRAVVSSLNWNQELKKFDQVESELIISKLGEYFFLNLKRDGLFTIVRLTGTLDGQFVIFEASSEKLKSDVNTGRISILENDDSHVFDLKMSKKELDIYVEENIVELFELTNVAVISPLVPPKEKSSQKKD